MPLGATWDLWSLAGSSQHGTALDCIKNDMKTEELEISSLAPWEGNPILQLTSCLASPPPTSLRSFSSAEGVLSVGEG